MGERRKRKSQWDMGDEMGEHNSWTGKNRHSSYDSGHYHNFPASGTSITPKSRDHSGWSAWESVEENPHAPMTGSFVDGRQNAEGKGRGGEKRYYKNMSAGFEEIGLRDDNHAREYDQNYSQRHPGRGRSRSRSRSRTRGRSRSLSRGRGRERSRSRSWSRSRNDGNAKDHARSRSPVAGDYNRSQSYGWNKRSSGVPDKSSQVCRDFAASGRCRRGSQCRFLHPNNTSDCKDRDKDLMEDDVTDSWRNRADHHSRTPKQSYSRDSGVFESRNDVVSDSSYHREEQQFRNKNRSEVPCKDFVRGKCHWGDSCRFSHHVSSDDDSFVGKGIDRNTSFAKDNIERQPLRNEKPLCKFFLAGKCDRDNCRFSHEDLNYSNSEGRQEKEITGRTHQKSSNWWNGPTWDDGETRVPNRLKPSGWDNETIVVPNTTKNPGENNHGKIDDTGEPALEIESQRWDLPECRDTNTLISQKQAPPLGERSSSYQGTSESITAKNNIANKQDHLVFHFSTKLQDQDAIVNVHGEDVLQENRSTQIQPLQQHVYRASHIQQQHHGVGENKLMNSFGPDALVEMKEPAERLHQNARAMISGSCSISNDKDGGSQNMLSSTDPLNGCSTASLNVSEIHVVGPSNFRTKVQDNQEIVHSQGISDPKAAQLLPNWLTSQHSAQVNNSTTRVASQQVSPVRSPISFPSQSLVNEQARTYAGINVSSSMGTMPSFPDNSRSIDLVNTVNVQPNLAAALSLGLFNPMKNGGREDNNEHGNNNLAAQGTEQSDQILLQQQPSSLSAVGAELDGSSKLKKHPEKKTRLGQDEVLAISQVATAGGSKEAMDVEEIKGVVPQESNKHSEALDGGQVNVEDRSAANKDEKGIRVFKNALVEFVKEILKPTWKEGRMSREAHKTVVKKVVDKVSSTIQVDHIPKTQEKAEQYLSFSQPKITKLIQAYVERCQKTDSNIPKADP